MKKADLKKLTGLSNGSLYYYEKLGLFQPNRTKNNYRLYDKSDFGKVICVQKYNRLGVTIQDLVIALTERDIEYLHGLLEKLQDQKKEELERIDRQVSYVNYLLKETNDIQQKLGCYEVVVNTPSVMFEFEKVHQTGDLEHFDIDRIGHWNQYLEYADLVFSIPEKELDENQFTHAIWYHTINKETADSFHDPFLDSLPVSKPCRALTCWIKVDKNSETDMLEQLKECVKYAREHDYHITGRIGARLFLLASDYAYFKVGLELEDD
ncbi:MAG: MerR family transcriptional regulator [Bulleidia sp.]|nr:MerR family transcriptional regulator [Erysipelotrichaceae bacterium]MDD6663210.1 MerR family transcriptional regulator [Bulleidia sp.]MDY4809225.1 MerR family transcriptional regulator [Bulleidia sp.]